MCTLVTKGTTPTTVGFGFENHGVNFVKVESITEDGAFVPGKLMRISQAAHEALSRSKLHEGDVLFTIAGTIGRTAIVPDSLLPANTNQAVAIARPNTSRVLPRFLRYVLSNPAFTISATSRTVQSVQANFSLAELKGSRVNLPRIAEQKVIVGMLGALDDRIALLRETNATLEAIARALFKSWFVDFDPVRAKQQGLALAGMDEATAALFPAGFEDSALGLVPKGWSVQPVGLAVECVGGATPDTKEPDYWSPEEHAWTTPKDLSGLPSPVLLGTERRLSTKGLAKIGSGLLPVGTLLMSSRAPIGYLAIAQVPVAINQGYIAMPPGGVLPPLYLLFWCQQNMEIIKARANGSTFMEISKKAFRPIPALVPPAQMIAAFEDVASPLFARIVENERQAQTLATLRDTLLPRLMSGQLRLPEAEPVLETV
jgi:type I restriction enzyme S subunit